MEKKHIVWIVFDAGGYPYLKSISYHRKDAIKETIDGWCSGDYTWRQLRGYGWKCKKVILTTN